jgi:hypothetical protein
MTLTEGFILGFVGAAVIWGVAALILLRIFR